ncbi:MAG: sce7725 family protein [Bacteroidales bacterium]|nr:sce7725 family protein [Bacteroidales bacterium]
MYFPYLRGKQFELKALREFSAEHQKVKSIVPIIEAVNSNYSTLNITIQELLANNIQFALIMNPVNGDFSHPNISFNIVNEQNGLLEHPDDWIPTYLFNGNPQFFRDVVLEAPYSQIMLVFRDAVDFVDNRTLNEIVSNEKVSYIVFNNGSAISRRSKRFLREIGKNIIGLNDCFNEKARNVDYLDNDDELFSEMPFYYNDDNLYGFSDYTALSSKYVEGGMMPYALAIHLTYQRNDDQIYIHHFVSDSNRTRADIRGKFSEAVRKIPPFYYENGITITKAVQDLINRANSGNEYPGLGYLKKLSVLNHLELTYRILQSNVN